VEISFYERRPPLKRESKEPPTILFQTSRGREGVHIRVFLGVAWWDLTFGKGVQVAAGLIHGLLVQVNDEKEKGRSETHKKVEKNWLRTISHLRGES